MRRFFASTSTHTQTQRFGETANLSESRGEIFNKAGINAALPPSIGLLDVYKRQVQSMSRKGNCIDNGATEQVFGHIKDEFFRGQSFESFEEFKERLEAYIVHWNTRRRQVKLKGLTPEEFRNQSLAA